MRRSLLFLPLFIPFILLEGCTDMGAEPGTPPSVPSGTGGTVSFSRDVLPIFQAYGCTGCHGGTNGLTVTSVPQLLQGGSHGPAVVPGNPDSSLLVTKISPSPPFGVRMPQGGPYLPDTTVTLIRSWISQGAKDN
jgi:hypothetical protein